MTQAKEQAARAFAFSGAALMLGVVIFFFTQGALPLVELPDAAGYIFILGFMFIFLNLNFLLGRRFSSRTFAMELFPYILALILLSPLVILSVLTHRFSDISSMMYFFGLLLPGSMFGSYLGIRSGQKKRDRLVQEALQESISRRPKP